jgi:hypothetical protein
MSAMIAAEKLAIDCKTVSGVLGQIAENNLA